LIYSREAERQVDDLRRHYDRLNRVGASENLAAALAEAETRIERNPDAGLRAPRPYPKLVRPGCAWLKAGRYWVAYTLTEPPLIVGVFFETADIPRRFAAY
jgi:plasmid stabilization system protein ParE